METEASWLNIKLDVKIAAIDSFTDVTMTEIPFDTMAAVRRLRDSGISEEQAEAITQTVRNGVTGGVATKADLDLIHNRLEQTASKTDLIKMENDLKWIKLIGGAILAVLILPWLAGIFGATMPDVSN